ncbi:hypothetical protein HZH68_001207 [Vespula germanica]|uniref:Uncharacterized protein n=1 Tax=Vespula germanica TaxID=30212 RepID=A0A834NVN0_VESGE|nr:hypothetical protein HZH68_001207 [Vespula germanica]
MSIMQRECDYQVGSFCLAKDCFLSSVKRDITAFIIIKSADFILLLNRNIEVTRNLATVVKLTATVASMDLIAKRRRIYVPVKKNLKSRIILTNVDTVTANVNESCFFHEQCEARVSQTECRDSRCICIFEKIPVTQPNGVIVCIAENKEPPSLQYVDPAMIGVLVGMALMFIIICVVLRLFSKARWRENRTIFNTPNARLMNVSLLRDNKLLHTQERRGSRASVRVPSRQPSMVSLRAHSPNASQGAKHSQHSQHRVFVLKSYFGFSCCRKKARDTLARKKSLSPGSRTGSRRGSRGSSGNSSAVSTKSNNKSPPNNPQNNVTDPVLENVTVEILEPKT